MDVAAAKMIGAGIACIALVGAGIGIGNVFGSYLSGALRNPGAAATQTTNLLLGFATTRAGEFDTWLVTHRAGQSRVRPVSVNRSATAQKRVEWEVETSILRGGLR